MIKVEPLIPQIDTPGANGYFLHIALESEQPVGHLMTDDEAGSNCSGRGERAQLYTENTALEERRERTRTAGSS